MDVVAHNIEMIKNYFCSPVISEVLDEAITRLKKFEPKKIHMSDGHASCPNDDCHEDLLRFMNYCPTCGQALKWD